MLLDAGCLVIVLYDDVMAGSREMFPSNGGGRGVWRGKADSRSHCGMMLLGRCW
jgi:hypothetical protein